MPMPDTDATSPKFLRDKYAIVGVGETDLHARLGPDHPRARRPGRCATPSTTPGSRPRDVDGMLSYSVGNDSTFVAVRRRRPRHPAQLLHGRVRRRLLHRGADRHRHGRDRGRHVQDRRDLPRHERLLARSASAAPARAPRRRSRATCCTTAPTAGRAPAQMFSPTFMRHMYEYGTTPEQVAHVQGRPQRARLEQSRRRSTSKRVTVDDVLDSRMICKPLHLLDCCVETDNATAIIVTSAERARDLRHPPVLIRGVVGRCCKPRADMHYQHGPISRVAGYYGREHPVAERRRRPRGHRRHRLLRRLHLHHHAAARGLRLLQEGRGRPLRQRRHHRARRQAPQQHQRRPPVRGLHPRHEHGDRERAPAAPRRRRLAVPSAPTASASTPTTTAKAAAGRCKTCEVTANLGWAMPGTGSAMVMRRG